MYQELRRDVRHLSSQKAVLLNEGDVGSLCVITNLSNRGLCLAVIGSSEPMKRERIDVLVKRETLLCNVVNKGREGLHCRFDGFIDEPEMSRMFIHYPVTPRAVAANSEIGWRQQALMPHLTYDNTGRWKTPDGMRGGGDPTRIYSEGCFAGRDQIDPAMEVLEATVEVLNPYQTDHERAHWAQGFTDAVCRMAKYRFRQ